MCVCVGIVAHIASPKHKHTPRVLKLICTHKDDWVAGERSFAAEDTRKNKRQRQESENTHDYLERHHYASHTFTQLLDARFICGEIYIYIYIYTHTLHFDCFFTDLLNLNADLEGHRIRTAIPFTTSGRLLLLGRFRGDNVCTF